ncbi:16S rRNA (cytosine(1402)-N(4))-methyltransferase RsmH [Yangia mangrovi]|uniref:Ribosomal RNA small subunit methyltransferase H n=1 Tax=Alloyangia mangrovi TaxID=1779329 RepID=A0A2A3JZF1_9RHOB|nr:16S rRNA (cytosine(1402)-N(4))-methyltransferase RsmH [Alloyangia mangrovi]MCA0939458.1 16S rRNA (cytosine(1402)-N(4))-methyltransferase RsmH [Alloyangia pacifica]MCA0943521.1 16S rRNA (cytosine(1402)-N(4))-methyltransferase RsmH [Alloyangia pacifica]MCT4372464.1 16S rRNA (cytosine(1402)-N(4))-methyltransferase RsmH [Alloyangia mangrovi]
MAAPKDPNAAPHVPVLLRPLLEAVAPVHGTWIDGTFGAGGYSRGLLEAGADKVIGIDRDPLAHQMAASWIGEYGDRLELVEDNFANMDAHAQNVDGVVLDLGVSSMQLDRAERGFSFQKDGPLDMRMEQSGETAADLVKRLDETTLADVLYTFGEERASRRIAKAIVKARAQEPIETTARLSSIVEACLPRPKPGQSHPATRSFQALRIAVNDEYGALWRGLMAAERALKSGGLLAVVTFHSVEDRMVKRFLQARSGRLSSVSRYEPEVETEQPRFELVTRKAVGPDDEELAQNPRSRSARLRVGRRTTAEAGDIESGVLSMPQLRGKS